MPDDSFHQDTDARLKAGDDRMTKIEHSLHGLREMFEAHAETQAASLQELGRQMRANTEVTQSIKDIVDTGKALFKLGGWIGAFIRWATPVAVAVGAAWALLSGKKLQ